MRSYDPPLQTSVDIPVDTRLEEAVVELSILLKLTLVIPVGSALITVGVLKAEQSGGIKVILKVIFIGSVRQLMLGSGFGVVKPKVNI